MNVVVRHIIEAKNARDENGEESTEEKRRKFEETVSSYTQEQAEEKKFLDAVSMDLTKKIELDVWYKGRLITERELLDRFIFFENEFRKPGTGQTFEEYEQLIANGDPTLAYEYSGLKRLALISLRYERLRIEPHRLVNILREEVNRILPENIRKTESLIVRLQLELENFKKEDSIFDSMLKKALSDRHSSENNNLDKRTTLNLEREILDLKVKKLQSWVKFVEKLRVDFSVTLKGPRGSMKEQELFEARLGSDLSWQIINLNGIKEQLNDLPEEIPPIVVVDLENSDIVIDLTPPPPQPLEHQQAIVSPEFEEFEAKTLVEISEMARNNQMLVESMLPRLERLVSMINFMDHFIKYPPPSEDRDELRLLLEDVEKLFNFTPSGFLNAVLRKMKEVYDDEELIVRKINNRTDELFRIRGSFDQSLAAQKEVLFGLKQKGDKDKIIEQVKLICETWVTFLYHIQDSQNEKGGALSEYVDFFLKQKDNAHSLFESARFLGDKESTEEERTESLDMMVAKYAVYLQAAETMWYELPQTEKKTLSKENYIRSQYEKLIETSPEKVYVSPSVREMAEVAQTIVTTPQSLVTNYEILSMTESELKKRIADTKDYEIQLWKRLENLQIAEKLNEMAVLSK